MFLIHTLKNLARKAKEKFTTDSVTVGSVEYARHIQEEIKFYKKVYTKSLFQEVPESWNKLGPYFNGLIKDKTGEESMTRYILKQVKHKKRIKLYSIGAGAGGIEIEDLFPLFKKNGISCHFTLTDINKENLERAKTAGSKKGMKIEIQVSDSNKIKLPLEMYDVIFAASSLHHLVDLDYVTKEINKGLKKDGWFVTGDICTRNGFLLWEDTVPIINALWSALPPKFKISMTAHAEPTYMDKFPDRDLAKDSFECIRSQEVVPALRRNLNEVDFVPMTSLVRRFFDTQFGPNYDLSKPLDRSIFECIIELDKYYLDNNILKPETFFGAYRKRL